MSHRRLATLILATLLAGAFASGSADASSVAKKVAKLRVLVTNDDGVKGEGLDELVQALRDQPKVTVVVVAPAEQQSGRGDITTVGPLSAQPSETLSGYEATAVNGTPADSVVYAIDELGLKPHLVVSGINPNQNFGPGISVSGTVGAAFTAARRGIPAIAVSQGAATTPDYAAGVEWFLQWLDEHRAEVSRSKGKGATEIWNLNVPTCLTGEVRGLLEDLPVATVGDYLLTADKVQCESTLDEPANDSEALNNGFASVSTIAPD